MKTLSFESQELILDYLTFTAPDSIERMEEFALIFSDYGFNCNVCDEARNSRYNLLQDNDNDRTVHFRIEKWEKYTVLMQFSGTNSRYIYQLLKDQFFSFSQLNCPELKIGRIDIHFLRENQKDDSNLTDFYQESKKVFKNRHKNGTAVIINNFQEQTKSLNLAGRKTDYYGRIYQKYSALKFELEVKKEKAEKLGLPLVHYSFLEFEHDLSKEFFNYWYKGLYLESSFTDWLNYRLRENYTKPNTHLVTSYLCQNFLNQATNEKLQFYRLLQFLSFIRSYQNQGQEEILNGQTYITVEFKLANFLKEVNPNSTRSTFQRAELISFFNNLQGMPPFKEQFAERKYKSILFFPVVNTIQKTSHGPWIIQIAIAEPLFDYSYPFYFPSSFLKAGNDLNLQVKLSIIRSFASDRSIKKTYSIERFFKEFENRNYSMKAKVKRQILQEFHNLLKSKIIQRRFIFVPKKNNQDILLKDNIELKDIHSSKYIYFYEIIHRI